MKINHPRIIGAALTVFVCALLIASCGKTTVTGQVVDAVTGEPINGAAVHIFWTKQGSGPPGLRGEEKIDIAEALTDENGRFTVPKYSTYSHSFNLAVYKEGYICWSSNKIFPNYEERKDFELKNSMVIELKIFKEEYSKLKHAHFTIVASINRSGGGIFDKAVESEVLILRKNLKKNQGD